MISINTNQINTTSPIQSEEGYKRDQEKEIRETIEATDIVLKHLGNAIGYIDKASEWGKYDFFHGGFFSSSKKFTKMEKANLELNAANKAIKNLNKELVNIKEIVPVNFSGYSALMDTYLDNVYADLNSQSKIAEAESKCKKAAREIKSIRSELCERLEQLQKASSTVPSETEIKEKQEMTIREILDLTKPTIECLKKASKSITKAKYSVPVDPSTDGLLYSLAESKVFKAREKIGKAILALRKYNKLLKNVQNIDPAMTNEISNFMEYAEDVINCNNIMFYQYAKLKYMKAGDSCIEAIRQIEAINNELKGRI